MKFFKHRKQAKGGSGTVTTTIELPEGVTPDQVTITTEGHGGPGREALHAHELTAAEMRRWTEESS